MKKLVAFAIAFIMLAVAAGYSWLICTNDAAPTLASWILFFVASFLSFWTSWSAGNRTVIGNFYNFCDLFAVSLILASIYIVSDEAQLGFTSFQLECLAASGLILIFWSLRPSKSARISNLMLQSIMTIAYFPTLSKLWSATVSPEPIFVWIGVAIASTLGFGLSISERHMLGIVYTARSLILSGAIIALIIRIQRI